MELSLGIAYCFTHKNIIIKKCFAMILTGVKKFSSVINVGLSMIRGYKFSNGERHMDFRINKNPINKLQKVLVLAG